MQASSSPFSSPCFSSPCLDYSHELAKITIPSPELRAIFWQLLRLICPAAPGKPNSGLGIIEPRMDWHGQTWTRWTRIKPDGRTAFFPPFIIYNLSLIIFSPFPVPPLPVSSASWRNPF
jgi:hypothetical protein